MTPTGDATALQEQLVRLRRTLHASPEIGLDLPRTQRTVLDALHGLDLDISTGTTLSSVTAVLHGAKPGPAVLLRGDMDALPVLEKTGLDYASVHEGAMHACGHDLHTAMLVGAARLLAARRDELAGSVVFMFQPGEESGWDGAATMIDEGVLEAAGTLPVAAYGLHVASAMHPHGTFVTRPGPLLAASDHLTVTVHGQGGHGSTPHRARDPIPAACEMVTNLQNLITRSFDPLDPVVLTVGSMHAGTRHNVIPDSATFEATVRSFTEASRGQLRDKVTRLMESIAHGYGLDIDVDYAEEYPATHNDHAETAFVDDTVTTLFGNERWERAELPKMGSEDFSHVLARIPGSFVWLGACPVGTDPESASPNHAPHATFDDSVLYDGATLLAELARHRLRMP